MSAETIVSPALLSDASFMGYGSAAALIDGVKRNTIPLCDLDLEQSVFETLPPTLLWDTASDKRIRLIEEQLEDPTRRLLVARQDGFVVGSVGIRFPSDLPHRANIYGLTVFPTQKGADVALRLMRSAVDTIYGISAQLSMPITEIRTGRYALSERKNPVGRMLTSAINQATPGAITTEEFSWKGELGTYYTMPIQLFDELIEEFGPKLAKFSL